MVMKSWLVVLLCTLVLSNASCAIIEAVAFVGDTVGDAHRRSQRRARARRSTSYYTPQVYRNRLVYFDEAGRPMTYRRGRRRYIQPTDAGYYAYVEHYRQNQANYWRWYSNVGYSYR